MFSSKVYFKRRENLTNKFGKGLILFLGNQNVSYNYRSNTYRYRQDSNFLYFFGIDEPNVAAIIDIDKNETILFGNNSEMEDIIWEGKQKDIADLAEKRGIKKVFTLKKLQGYIDAALKLRKKIHFCPPYRGETNIQLSELLGIPVTGLIKKSSVELIQAIICLRSIKDSLEISEIEKMIDVAWLMHTAAMKLAKPGNTEQKIAGTLEGICIANSYSVSFPIICSIHGEILHNVYFANTLKKGQMLLTDAGAESYSHYASDITRVSPVGGNFSEIQKSIYKIVLTANLEVIKLAKPGMFYKDIHLAAAKIIIEGLKNMGLMKGNTKEALHAGAHALFFPHGLGHMLGLDVHDMEGLGEDNVGYNKEIRRSNQFGLAYLRMARKLEPGFVVTDEPGIYFIPTLIDQWQAEKKFTQFINYNEVTKYRDFGGVRIEDDVLITDTGCRVLGKPIPKTIDEVEFDL